MCENSKHTCDERYLRTEAKIQNTVDTMFEQKRAVTKVRDFCVSAGISPATFYGHYRSIGEVIFERDSREVENLLRHLKNIRQKTNNPLKTEIIFQKTFHYINQHKTYFKSAAIRDNISLYKELTMILEPILLENWHDYHKWDENRGAKLEKICHKLAFEVAGEYNEWIRFEKFDRNRITPHTKHLIYLANTACQRLDK